MTDQQIHWTFGLLLLSAACNPLQAEFSDVTDSAGIQHSHWMPTHGQNYREAFHMAGGAAAGDFDGDGWPDLYVTRLEDTDILYRNNRDGTFSDVSTQAGFTMSANTNGAAWGDIDNDGDADLYVSAIESSQFYLYINNGRGQFEEQASLRGASLASPFSPSGYSVAFGDYDLDGYLDLHTTEWGGTESENVSRLLRNQGASNPGHFVDVTQDAGVALTNIGQIRDQPVNGVFSFASRFADMDKDGYPDLVIAGDFRSSRLFWNNGDGTFTDGTVAAHVGSDENGMGSAIGDYDGDGDLDWFVTSIYDANSTCTTPGQFCNWGDSGNRLFRNNGSRQFSDETDAMNVRDGGWGWGSTFLDYDLDGDLDLTMTNGFRLDNVSIDDPFNHDAMRLWRNDGLGTPFTDVAASTGVTDQGNGKGLLTFDYDQDGDLDLFVVNNAGSPVLYRNDQDGGNAWLVIDVEGTDSNRDGIGVKVFVDPDTSLEGDEQYREIAAGSNFLGQNESIAAFGLADAAMVDVMRLEWPSGIVQEFYDVPTNQRLVIAESVPEPSTVPLLLIGFVGLSRRKRHANSGQTGFENRDRGST